MNPRPLRTTPADSAAGSDPLSRSYRRLLRAYPGWYRRQRGLEMLTTLMDAAGSGPRMTGRDRLDLLVGGLRCRLRPPRGIRYRLVAALGAWLVGIAAMGMAGLLLPDVQPPDPRQAVAAAAVAMGEPPRGVAGPPQRCGMFPCEIWAGPDDVSVFAGPVEVGPPAVEIRYNHPPEQTADRLSQAVRRLAGAGWQVTDVAVEPGGVLTFTAVRDGVTLAATGYTREAVDRWAAEGGDARAAVYLAYTREFPPIAVVQLLAVFAAGLLVGWLVAAWALQCYRRHGPKVQFLMVVGAMPGMMTSLFFGWGVGILGLGVTVEGGSPRQVLVPADLLVTMSPLALLAGASYLAVLGLAALPRRAGEPAPVGPVGVG